MTVAELLTDQMDDTRKWLLLLVEDLVGDEWGHQPAAGLPHPLWVCGHVAVAQNLLIFKRCLGTSELDDEFSAHFPLRQPVWAISEHGYPTAAEVLKVMSDMHARAGQVVRGMTDEFLAEPAYGKNTTTRNPHYTDKCGAIAHVARHEAFHAGQVAMIRRLLGRSFLR